MKKVYIKHIEVPERRLNYKYIFIIISNKVDDKEIYYHPNKLVNGDKMLIDKNQWMKNIYDKLGILENKETDYIPTSKEKRMIIEALFAR